MINAPLVPLAAERCRHCPFGPNWRDVVQPGRVKDIIEECKESDVAFVCHKFLLEKDQQGRPICRGWYDSQEHPAALQIAARLGCVYEVPLPGTTLPPAETTQCT